MLVRLVARQKMFGVNLRPTEDVFKLQTEGGIYLKGGNEFNPEMWVPTEGKVELSCMPEVKVGDHVHMEYFGVIIELGRWWNPGAEVDERNFILDINSKGEKVCKVWVKPKFLYYIENQNGTQITMLNGYNVVQPIEEKASKTLTIPNVKTNFAYVSNGKHSGKTVIFHRFADMGMIAHKRVVIQDKYIDGILDGDNILPVGRRYVIRPDKPLEVTPGGIVIPPSDRKPPCHGTVIATAEANDLQIGDHVYYSKPDKATQVITRVGTEWIVSLIFKEEEILGYDERE